jgi:hypothetical protein
MVEFDDLDDTDRKIVFDWVVDNIEVIVIERHNFPVKIEPDMVFGDYVVEDNDQGGEYIESEIDYYWCRKCCDDIGKRSSEVFKHAMFHLGMCDE